MQRALRRVEKTIFFATVVLLTFVTSARAAGLLLYETGAPDLGTASAGRTAMASDASTVAANPAGMSLLDRSQLLGAAGALLPFTNFDVAPETTTSGGGGANAGVFFPIGSFFYVYKLSERVRLGFASDSDFGLSADWGKKWVGRYYATSVSIVTFKTNPSISYLVNDWLSVGAGFSFSVGRLTEQAKINNVLPRAGDGGLALESWDEAFGGNAGILLTPIKKLRIGLTYQSPSRLQVRLPAACDQSGPAAGPPAHENRRRKNQYPDGSTAAGDDEFALRRHAVLERDGQRRMAELVRVR